MKFPTFCSVHFYPTRLPDPRFQLFEGLAQRLIPEHLSPRLIIVQHSQFMFLCIYVFISVTH